MERPSAARCTGTFVLSLPGYCCSNSHWKFLKLKELKKVQFCGIATGSTKANFQRMVPRRSLAQIELMCFLPCKNRSYCRDLYPLNITVAKVKEGSETLTYFKEEKKREFTF